MLSTGIDIQHVADFDIGNIALMEKIFTGNELKNLKKNNNPHIAGLFSAKEAVIKACSPLNKLQFKDIEILHKKDGSPYAIIKNHREISSKLKISISHSKDYAVAIAVVSD